MEEPPLKPVIWVGSALKDLRAFPAEVKDKMGFALYVARARRQGGKCQTAHRAGSAGVLEIVEDFRSDTYRAVYTVKFERVIYVLHAFQKKSKRGSKTPQRDLDLIKQRLQQAEKLHRQRKDEESV